MTESQTNVWYYLLKNAELAQKLSDYYDGRIHFVDVDISVINDISDKIYPENLEGHNHVSQVMELALSNTEFDYIYVVEIEDIVPVDMNSGLSIGDSVLIPLNHPYPHNNRNRPDSILNITNIHQRDNHRTIIAENINGIRLDYRDTMVPLLSCEWIRGL